MQNMSSAALYALVFGAVLAAAGIIGFFYESSFTNDESVRDHVFGILAVNGWHNVVHLATGALGLIAFAAGAYAARSTRSGSGSGSSTSPSRLGIQHRRRRLDPQHHPRQH